MTPMAKAWRGDTEPMLQQIKAHVIGVDDLLSYWEPEDLKANKYTFIFQMSPLCLAINADNTDAVSQLLKLGANIYRRCGSDSESLPAMDYALKKVGLKPNSEAILRVLMAKSGVTSTGKVITEADIRNAKVENPALLKRTIAESIAKSAREEQQRKEDEIRTAEANDAKSKASSNILGKVMTGAFVAGMVGSSSISDEGKAKIVGAVASDLATDGKTSATANLLSSQSQVPSTAALAQNIAQDKSTAPRPTGDQAWKTCGPNKWCAPGNGYTSFCAGPPRGFPGCKEGCRMTSGVAYHDTALTNNAAYIPSSDACGTRCDVRNSCN